MSITAERKAELIKDYATKAGDTGSPEVQVAILTERITNLTEHFKSHGKDNHSLPAMGPASANCRKRPLGAWQDRRRLRSLLNGSLSLSPSCPCSGT